MLRAACKLLGRLRRLARPGYARFLAAAERYYGRPVRAVLDLACGTGHLARRLAPRSASVVGLDGSEAMPREARRCTRADNIRFVVGDFRDFRLDQAFDAVTCSGDSLNYVGAPAGSSGLNSHCCATHPDPFA